MNRIFMPEISLNLVSKCIIEKKVGEHGRATIQGYINKETEIALLEQDHQGCFYSIMLEQDGSEEAVILFCGIMEQVKILSDGEVKQARITLIGGTRLLDGRKRIRTFQNTSLTYENLFQAVDAFYPDASHLLRHENRAIERILVQYQESDWTFLKRIASHLNLPIVPQFRNPYISYYIGIEPEMPLVELEVISSVKTNCLEEYFQKEAEYLDSLYLPDVQYKEVVSRIFCELGDMVLAEGEVLCVHSMHSELLDGEFIHTYQLKIAQGFRIPKQYNYAIVGASLYGQVLDVQQDKVKVQIIGEQQETATASWFPYSTVYSSPDGSGWYCMPEKFDGVRLYFPSEKEAESYVISSVHLPLNSPLRSNPDHKSISTKYGKLVELTPNSIMLTNNKGMSVVLNDTKGIQIVSDKNVIIESGGNIYLGSRMEGVTLEAVDSIELIQGSAKITLKEDVIVEGAKFKLE